MIKLLAFLAALACCVCGQSPVPITAAPPQPASILATVSPRTSPAARAVQLPPVQMAATDLRSVRRVYVDRLSGGVSADALRELIITSLDGTRLFVLTDDPERADAVLKGAADDRAFTDTFDSDKSLHDSANLGGYTAANTKTGKLGGYGSQSLEDRDSHHIRERKHEAYAAVRLCGRNGDILWSTTQESNGSKFRGAAADVASKIARQIQADYQAGGPLPPR